MVCLRQVQAASLRGRRSPHRTPRPRYDATITDGDDSIHLWAELGSDENLVDDHATVFMASNKDDGLMFDGPSLDTAIASLGEFLDGLRHLRQVMGQGRAE